MSRLLFQATIFACAMCLTSMQSAQAAEAMPIAEASGTSMTIARDAVLPHVVSILVVREDFSGGEARLSLSGASRNYFWLRQL